MKVIGIIPARYHSTRLPKKMLRLLGGKPLVQHVWEQCRKAVTLTEVIVATDHEDIRAAVQAFGGKAVMTDPDHQSGTDRLVEVVRSITCDVAINIQGDEPFIDPAAIDSLAKAFEKEAALQVATLCNRGTSLEQYQNPNCVKVVRDRQGYALYFSRAMIPFDRDGKGTISFFKHIGIYAFRRDFLLGYSSLPQSTLEQSEKLEQLRILEAGEKIKVIETDYDTCGIDTEEDLQVAEKIYTSRKKKEPRS